MVLSAVIPPRCCGAARMELDRHGDMVGRGDAVALATWRVAQMEWNVVWNWILPCFRYWELLLNWQEDWLVGRGDWGSWDFMWCLFLSLRAKGERRYRDEFLMSGIGGDWRDRRSTGCSLLWEWELEALE
jgi:hypothetical protein